MVGPLSLGTSAGYRRASNEPRTRGEGEGDGRPDESFFATIKRELIDRRPWPTRAGLRTAVFEYIEGWYNTRRLHRSLGYLSPAEYESRIHHNAVAQAA